jgi:hypothetical protein
LYGESAEPVSIIVEKVFYMNILKQLPVLLQSLPGWGGSGIVFGEHVFNEELKMKN